MKRLLLCALFIIMTIPSTAYGISYSGGGLVPQGTSTPGTCKSGELFNDTDSDILYICEPDDTWVDITGSGGGAPSSHASQHDIDGSDPVNRFFQGADTVQLTVGDATPAVEAGRAYYTWGGSTVTITDFVDSDGDHSEFADGDYIGVFMNDPDVTIDFATNTIIHGNSQTNFTGSSTNVVFLIFTFGDSGGGQWFCANLFVGMSDPVTLAYDTLQLPYTTSGNATIVEGLIHQKSDEDAIGLHFGAIGEIQDEALMSGLFHVAIAIDAAAYYDQEDNYRTLPLFKVGDDFPHGFTLTEWRAAFVSDNNTTALDMDLVCDVTPDFNPAAGGNVLDSMDIGAAGGSSSADTGFAISTCANASEVYLRFGADPTDANEVLMVDIWGYANED